MITNTTTDNVAASEQIPMVAPQTTNEGVPPEQVVMVAPPQQVVIVSQTAERVTDRNEYFRKQLQSPDQSCCCGLKSCNLWLGGHIWIIIFLIINIIRVIRYILYIAALIAMNDYEQTNHLHEALRSDPVRSDPVRVDPSPNVIVDPVTTAEPYPEVYGYSMGALIVFICVTVIGIIINVLAFYGLYTCKPIFILLQFIWIFITIIGIVIDMITYNYPGDDVFTWIIALCLYVWAGAVFHQIWTWARKAQNVPLQQP